MPEQLPAFRIATHGKPAPFACDGVLRLSIEANPFRANQHPAVIGIRCLECGEILSAWGVLPEPRLVKDGDDQC
jgi:hypothetical protein